MKADSMKLIAYGKIMEDDVKKLTEYSLKDGDFIVVMVQKVRVKQRCAYMSVAEGANDIAKARREKTRRGTSCFSRSAASSSAASSIAIAFCSAVAPTACSCPIGREHPSRDRGKCWRPYCYHREDKRALHTGTDSCSR